MAPLIAYFRLAFKPGRDVLLFALRTVLAGLLCLYLAFVFDLEQPKWALMTVIIISLPLAGMTLKRSLAQVLGTVVGAAVAVLLMALFAQMPYTLVASLALWLGLCTAGGTLLRYTDSHAFVLSGFTAVVVAMLAVPEPEGTFMLAVTRVTETLLAVACVAVVSLLTARPQAVAKSYFAKVDSLLKLIARHAAEVVRTEEDEAAFRQRQAQLIAEISALEGLRRHLYFDAPHLRSGDGLVQLFANQLVLLVSRLLVLRQQRELVKAHWQGPLPTDIQLLRDAELDSLEALAREGMALSTANRQTLRTLHKGFDEAADRAEFLSEPLPPKLRALAWALRWEQARLLQQLDELIELNEAIQQGRLASCPAQPGRAGALHLDWPLAGMNAVRACLALLLIGGLWIESAWDGARSAVILMGVMCSLMATLPRPLLASQNYNRGLLVGMGLSALYQFALLPLFSDFEMLALCLVPLLYLAAVGLANPMTAGIGMGIGLISLLMIGPQNVGAYHNSDIQWFEFAGGYLMAGVLAMIVFALVFPFNPQRRIARLFQLTREDVHRQVVAPGTLAGQFAFESRQLDRLSAMIGLLPAVTDPASRERFDCALVCPALAIALAQARSLCEGELALPLLTRQRLLEGLQGMAEVIGGQGAVELDALLQDVERQGQVLDTLHGALVPGGREALRQLFILRVALAVAGQLLARYRAVLATDIPAPLTEVVDAH
ncbi:FUSC family protein [Pseudomonas xantholysinigenes]|uniref:FUSC family protein n=1 Tax=Pseudomonas xantholysinigenes TaxID=2745490 RepID=A0A9E6PVD5_9PSED|nr:FUSC family protein [Pseudomonas xantholysinigenes]QXI37798.1 FUSC family protein [Pseudomonas xantholysinigenes]